MFFPAQSKKKKKKYKAEIIKRRRKALLIDECRFLRTFYLNKQLLESLSELRNFARHKSFKIQDTSLSYKIKVSIYKNQLYISILATTFQNNFCNCICNRKKVQNT